MSGTWTTPNKKLPGAYINVKTNVPLAITVGERGTVAILQEIASGKAGDMYTITATENDWPEDTAETDKKLAEEALKNAKTVKVFCLLQQHTKDDLDDVLEKLKTSDFDTVCYPYDGETYTAQKDALVAWVKAMREDEGASCQLVVANAEADYEGVIDVTQGVILTDGTQLPPEQVTAWVAGATAGASMTTSNTYKKYVGAIDIAPRMTRAEMEEAVDAGKLIFKVDTAQNVMVEYDINSLTTFTPEKGKMLSKNRVLRTVDGIKKDITAIFEGDYIGKVNNSEEGRSLLRAALVDYFNVLQNKGAIQEFEESEVEVIAGPDTDAVIVNAYAQPIDSIEKMLITVNLNRR